MLSPSFLTHGQMNKILILGAGPSGLGIAWGLLEAGEKDILILEKAEEVGGLCGSFRIGENILDYGPHRLSPEHPEIVARLKGLLGKELLEVPNDHAVVFQERVYRYPPTPKDCLNLKTLFLIVRIGASYLYAKLRILLTALAGRRKENPSFEERIVDTFGTQFYRLIVLPLCKKIWGDPQRIDPGFAQLRFSLPKLSSWFKRLLSREAKFNDKVFYYPKQGFGQIWTELAKHLESRGVEIWRNTEVTQLKVQEGRIHSAKILTNEERLKEIPVKWVFSTIATQTLLPLLRPNPIQTPLLTTRRFVNLSVLLVVFVINRPKTLPARVLILPETKYSFNRLYEQNQFSPYTVKPGTSVITADIITERKDACWSKPDQEIIDQVQKELLTCRFFEASEILETHLVRVPTGYPQPTAQRELAQKQINKELSQIQNLICTGRFASSDYNNSHTALKKGMEAAQLVLGHCGIEQWYAQSEHLRAIAIRD